MKNSLPFYSKILMANAFLFKKTQKHLKVFIAACNPPCGDSFRMQKLR